MEFIWHCIIASPFPTTHIDVKVHEVLKMEPASMENRDLVFICLHKFISSHSVLMCALLCVLNEVWYGVCPHCFCIYSKIVGDFEIKECWAELLICECHRLLCVKEQDFQRMGLQIFLRLYISRQAKWGKNNKVFNSCRTWIETNHVIELRYWIKSLFLVDVFHH